MSRTNQNNGDQEDARQKKSSGVGSALSPGTQSPHEQDEAPDEEGEVWDLRPNGTNESFVSVVTRADGEVVHLDHNQSQGDRSTGSGGLPRLRLSKEDVLASRNFPEVVSSPGCEDNDATVVGEEDSELVSEHLQQLGARLELGNLFQGPRPSTASRVGIGRDDSPPIAIVTGPSQSQEEHNWANLARESILGNQQARSDYCDKLSVCGVIGPGRVSQRSSMIAEHDANNRRNTDISQLPTTTSTDGQTAPVRAPRVSSCTPAEGLSGSVVVPPISDSYIRLLLPSHTLAIRASMNPETVQAVKTITGALLLRQKFIMKWHIHDSPAVQPPLSSTDLWASREPRFLPYECPTLGNIRGYSKMIDGVAHIYSDLRPENENLASYTVPKPSAAGMNLPLITESTPIPSVTDYLGALKELMVIAQSPACKSLCYQRLRYLEERFSLHQLFNGNQEMSEMRNNIHRDFYNVRKVDTHVHHSACMTQKHLLRFVRRKYRTEGNEIVAKNVNGEPVTLIDIFRQEIGLTAYETSIDHLDVHALNSCFHRFDLFNTKYNPFGAALLREVFLKTDNLMGGRYLAELTREVIDDLEAAKYQHVEWRISIYGHSKTEWAKLARWMKRFNLYSKNVRWVIQVPRLYHIYKKRGVLNSMQDFLNNVFEPVIEAVLRPQDNPEILQMLRQTVAWDSVDDESQISKFTTDQSHMPAPSEWTQEDNPPYAYFAYYMYANIRSLNHLLQLRGLNAMPFRPHCGEAGSISHLASAALLADGINHGIMLRKSPVLNYLYYLWQIGIAMSPLSNNALFHEISKSPFHSFFRIGLNVSLSSDDPLMFHFTDEALLEEYSVCAHTWKLNQVDLCEIARNSVLQSNFDAQFKRHWVGPNYFKKGPRGNDIRSSNVANIRLTYREETLKEELKFLRDVIVTTTEDMRSNGL